MYQLIDKSGFHDAFRDMSRLANFSYEGRNALFEYLEELAIDMDESGKGIGFELDVICLCCEYTEARLNTIIEEYDSINNITDLEDQTQVIYVDENSSDESTNPLLIYAVF